MKYGSVLRVISDRVGYTVVMCTGQSMIISTLAMWSVLISFLYLVDFNQTYRTTTVRIFLSETFLSQCTCRKTNSERSTRRETGFRSKGLHFQRVLRFNVSVNCVSRKEYTCVCYTIEQYNLSHDFDSGIIYMVYQSTNTTFEDARC